MDQVARQRLHLVDRNALIALAFLSLSIWVAHFLNFLQFGLYEDDYALISGMWRLPDFLENTRSALMDWPQGRPIEYLLFGIFSFAGEKLGGLSLIYIMGFAVVTLNAFLYYVLLRAISTEITAVMGALAFGLFPADTTHSFLTHSLGLQTSITFFLLATNLYLSGSRAWSYVPLSASLLTYESPFPVFLAIPLLANAWDRTLVRKLLINAGILAAIVLVAIVVRVAFGEERVADVRGDFPGVLKIIAKSVVIGPATSMAQFINAPVRAILNWNATLTIFFVPLLAVSVWMLRRSAQALGRHLDTWQLFLTGLAMLLLAYVLSFTHFPPIATYGRATSVHLASALGGSLVFACIGSQFVSLAGRLRLRTVAIILLSAYFSLVMAYRILIQDDFMRAWQNQRSFWASAIAALPDVTEDTIIFVPDRNLPKTAFILSSSWADPIILGQLFDFPKHWKNPPRLFVVNTAWPRAIMREGNHFKWMVPDATWFAHWETLPDSNVILLNMENGELVRQSGTVKIDGWDLNLKVAQDGAKLNFERGPLYRYLIGDSR